MAIQTVCDIFYRSVDTYRKPEHLKYKKDGAWRAMGPAAAAFLERLGHRVDELAVEPVRNSRGELVGEIAADRPRNAKKSLASRDGGC